jgi:hypothetical protein
MAKRDPKQLANCLSLIVKKYARKRQNRSCDYPNDRTYDREIERRVRRMSPEELNRLLREQ